MQLIGQTVLHRMFGEGSVTEQTEATVTVAFPQGEKNFIYPDAFRDFLELRDRDVQQELLTRMDLRAQEEQEREHRAHARWEHEVSLRNMRISVRSQGAFDVEPEQVEEIFRQGWVFAGTYLSGISKGEPRVPERMKPNSLCVLTVRPKDQPENQRRIAGVFMVEDTFYGSQCTDGRIPAHRVYRRRLENGPLFWPYAAKTGREKWGSAAFKYLENEAGQRILQDLQRQDPELTAFYRYYCRINHLDK